MIFVQEFPRIHSLAGVRRTKLKQYDSIVRPIQAWLTARGVVTEFGVRVTDLEFSARKAARRVDQICYERDGKSHGYPLGPDDYAFITLGSMTADATSATTGTSPPK